MSKSLIAQLKTLIERKCNEEEYEEHEYLIIEEIEKLIKEEQFYELPTNEILKIINKSTFADVNQLYDLVANMSASKGEESILLLNVINCDDMTLKDCTTIISKFKKCKFCQRTYQVFKENEEMPEIDYELEIKELNEEIERLKKEIEELKNKTKEEEKSAFL